MPKESEQTHYDILGIPRDADPQAVLKAYRQAALNTHPDRHPGDKQAEAAFKAVNAAFHIISDPLQKSAYDRSLQTSPFASSRGSGNFQSRPNNATKSNWNQYRESERRQRESENQATLETAKQMFGAKFFGQEAVEQVLGFRLNSADIPPIPFSEGELHRARYDNHQLSSLILRVDKDREGEPLTIERLRKRFAEGPVLGNGLRMTFNVSEKDQKEPFYRQDTPRSGWAIVSHNCIPNSTNHYLDQSRVLASYLENKVYFEQSLPSPYTSAINELNSLYNELYQELPGFGRMGKAQSLEYSRRLVGLQINQLLRRTPVELLFDAYLYSSFNNRHGTPMIYKGFERTLGLSSDGLILGVGSTGLINSYGLWPELPNNSGQFVLMSQRVGNFNH